MIKENFEYNFTSSRFTWLNLKFIFIYDSNVSMNSLYWNTILTYSDYIVKKESYNDDFPLSELIVKIYYNIPIESKIKSVTDNIKIVFSSYIEKNIIDIGSHNANFLIERPSPDSKLPDWVSYNPEREVFCFKVELFLKLQTDNSSVRQCLNLTKSNTNFQKSINYQYANNSKFNVCSNPIFKSQSNKTQICNFVGSDVSMSTCSGYSPDEKLLYKTTLINNSSKNKIELETYIYRSLEDSFKIEIKNTSINVIALTLNYQSTILFDNLKLYEEAFVVLTKLLETYKNDYTILDNFNFLTEKFNTVSVNIKPKKSYISNLILGESNGDRKDKLLQTIV